MKRLARTWNHEPEHIKQRAERNAARRELEKKGTVHKGDGNDVDHKKPLIKGGSNNPKNWQVLTAHANRSKGAK